MTFPELQALIARLPKSSSGGLSSDEQADLYSELKEQGLL